MRSIALPEFEQAEENVVADANELMEVRPEVRRHAGALVLPFLALLLWLLAGSLITWLVADFDRTLAPARSTFPPWFMFSLFLAPVIVAGWFFVRSWKRTPSRSTVKQ